MSFWETFKSFTKSSVEPNRRRWVSSLWWRLQSLGWDTWSGPSGPWKRTGPTSAPIFLSSVQVKIFIHRIHFVHCIYFWNNVQISFFHSFKFNFLSFKFNFHSFKLNFHSFKLNFHSLKLNFHSFKLNFHFFKLNFHSLKSNFLSFKLNFYSFNLNFYSIK